jgi:hypothetical protein
LGVFLKVGSSNVQNFPPDRNTEVKPPYTFISQNLVFGLKWRNDSTKIHRLRLSRGLGRNFK